MDNGMEDYLNKFIKIANDDGILDFDLENVPDEIKKQPSPLNTGVGGFCRGEAFLIARILVDTGFIKKEISAKQFIAIVEIIYKLQHNNATN